MDTTFLRSTLSLRSGEFRRLYLTLLAVLLLLGGWGVWFFLARVSVYETSGVARLLVHHEAHSVESPLAGRIVHADLVLGKWVESGDLLVELESDLERHQIEKSRRQIDSLRSELSAAATEAGAKTAALKEARMTAEAVLDEARASWREAEVASKLAREEADRLGELRGSDSISDLELIRAQSEAAKKDAMVETQRLTMVRRDLEQRTALRDREGLLAELERERARLEGEIELASAALERLQLELDMRRITAPVSGIVGEAARIQVGAFVEEGERIAAIIPEGDHKVLAHFDPPDVLGRIEPGLEARVRFPGFPWSQYGTRSATVARVGSEVRDGRVEVEFSLRPDSSSAIPVRHGLPATVEVKVEEISPATLVLRAAGKLLTHGFVKSPEMPDRRP